MSLNEFNKRTLVSTINHLISDSKYSDDLSINDRISIARTLFNPDSLGYDIMNNDSFEDYVEQIVKPIFLEFVGDYVSSTAQLDDILEIILSNRGKVLVDAVGNDS